MKTNPSTKDRSSQPSGLVRLLLPLFLLISLLAACSSPMTPRQRLTAPPYHGNTLSNFTVARLYMSQGRFELAREHLLFALSSARDEEMRLRLAQELEAVELMIATKR